MTEPSPTNGFPAAFFALTLLLSVPFYVLNALAYLHIVGDPELEPVYIALFTVTTFASAAILTFRGRGTRGVRELLKRIAAKRWYVPTLFLGPLIL